MSKYNEDEYLAVKEFAKRAGVTYQAVYQKIKNKHSFNDKYVRNFDGITKIHVSALWEVYGQPEPTDQNDAAAENVNPEIEAGADHVGNDPRQELIQVLKKQLETKDKQIADQQEHITQLTDALRAQQVLTAQANNKIHLLESAAAGRTATESSAASESADISSSSDSSVSSPAAEANSKGRHISQDSFITRFRRLFRKDE